MVVVVAVASSLPNVIAVNSHKDRSYAADLPVQSACDASIIRCSGSSVAVWSFACALIPEL